MKVTLVSQVSIDGKITLGEKTSSKELFALLTEEDMKFIHGIRGAVDGILVGMNTIRYDNPSLTCRYNGGKNPIRIIPTNSMNVPKDVTIVKDNESTIFITNKKNSDKVKCFDKYDNISCILCGEDKLDIVQAFEILEKEYHINHIMLEGGGELNWSLVELGLVDEIIVMQLPVVIGGRSNISLVGGEGFHLIDRVRKFKLVSVEMRENISIHKYVRK